MRTITGLDLLFTDKNNVKNRVNRNWVPARLDRNQYDDGAMGQANYQFIKGLSKSVSDWVIRMGLSNPKLYGTNNNVGNIRENASYKDDKTVWDNITATQENWSNTQIPKLYTPILTYILRNLFFPARQEGLLPVIKHAQFNGW